MKTYKNLYARIADFENLFHAFKNAARGKRRRPDVAEFEFRLEENLVQIREELLEKLYEPGPYHNFSIHDPKPRLISAAPFRDRVVHHALCQIIEPLFEARFVYDSYACRVGKGTHAALDRAQEHARKYPYVLKCDVERFFPSMDYGILMAQLERVIGDRDVLWLCRQVLESGADIHGKGEEPRYFPGDSLLSPLRPKGLPIGNLTSQFWANVYLNPMDHFIKRALGCKAYVRYVDDLLLFSDQKTVLHEWRKEVFEYGAKVRLRYHESQAQVFPVSTGIPFLGWRVYPDHRRLRRRNGVAFQRRFSRLREKYSQGRIGWTDMTESIQGWIAHVSHGDTWGLRRALVSSHTLRKKEELSERNKAV